MNCIAVPLAKAALFICLWSWACYFLFSIALQEGWLQCWLVYVSLPQIANLFCLKLVLVPYLLLESPVVRDLNGFCDRTRLGGGQAEKDNGKDDNESWFRCPQNNDKANRSKEEKMFQAYEKGELA